MDAVADAGAAVPPPVAAHGDGVLEAGRGQVGCQLVDALLLVGVGQQVSLGLIPAAPGLQRQDVRTEPSR